VKRTPLVRKTRIPPVNRKRRVSKFARTYHSKARVRFVKSLPCAACGIVGYSENAHVLGNDGMSRKGHYTTIAPLCRTFVRSGRHQSCHSWFDIFPKSFATAHPSFNPARAAAETEQAWQAFLREGPVKRAGPCKTCAFFRQTYKHDIEREEYAYQEGTCVASQHWRTGVPAVPAWQTVITVDRDDVRECHVA
jgi:hypothetical protein